MNFFPDFSTWLVLIFFKPVPSLKETTLWHSEILKWLAT